MANCAFCTASPAVVAITGAAFLMCEPCLEKAMVNGVNWDEHTPKSQLLHLIRKRQGVAPLEMVKGRHA